MIRIRWVIVIAPMTVVGADDDDVSNRRAIFAEICFGTVCESTVATCFVRIPQLFASKCDEIVS